LVSTKNILKYIALLLSSGFLLTGCGSNFNSHMDKILNEYVCEQNSEYRVGPTREVVLFVKHHIMVGGADLGDDRWDETGFTHSPRLKIPWQNERMVFYRQQTIPTIMEGVNKILYDNDTNISLVSETTEIHTDNQFFPADFDLLGNPQGHTREVMQRIVAEDPGYIHILYGWTSSTTLLVAGDNFAVVVADDPRYGKRLTSIDLAREIINSLGYTPRVDNDDNSNLLHHKAVDNELSDEQNLALWDVINEKAQSLKSISCAPKK